MTLKRVRKFLGIVLIALLCTVLLPLLGNLWLSWYNALGSGLKLTIDLAQIGFIAVLFAGLLLPLEALGWWGGWYGDKIDTIHPKILESAIQPQTDIVRYVIFLDGITQASFQYLPDREEFLFELAKALPSNITIVKGHQPDSGLKKPSKHRILSFNGGIIGAIRDLLVVAVSADQRYGAIYNQRIAQILYKSLINHGYQSNSGVPITLIGLGGGAQIAMGALGDLKQALNAPIEVISLGGLITGNNNPFMVEHLYHLVGDLDLVERLGLILSPRRWKVFFLSYWNRAKHRGKISFTSLGPVGHTGASGLLDANKFLPDGRSHLRSSVDMVSRILHGEFPNAEPIVKTKVSNYERYRQAAFNRPEYYPLNQSVNTELYRPIATWMGRLILPLKEQRQSGVLFEVHHAAPEHEHLVGQVVYLKWIDDPKVKILVQSIKKDVHFSEKAFDNYKQGKIEPIRVNHWQQVTPLESLAGSRPNDDVIVMLHSPVVVDEHRDTAHTLTPSQTITLYITSEPVQISGRFYGLVKFLHPIQPGSEQFRVVHFNRATNDFDSVEEVVLLPEVIPFEEVIYPPNGCDLEKSPLNATGWYIYGAKDANGMFVVQALAPRALLRLQPEQVIFGKKAAIEYLRKRTWHNITTHKGQIQSVLVSMNMDIQQAVSGWREGDRALLVHVYGGIGGKKRESSAKSPIYFGHFAYGLARVVREPLTGELRFDIEYHQVYCHNRDGLIAGTLDWTRYMGDRQFGWLGIRPVADILIKLDAVTEDYEVKGVKGSPLRLLIRQLEIMTARYRIGDGTGVTFVGPANNCSQDSNQALYAAIRTIQVALKLHNRGIPFAIKSNPQFKNWLIRHPELATCLKQVVNLGEALRHELLPFGVARADWENSIQDLGTSLEDSPLQQLFTALVSWRTILPRRACDTVTQIFMEQGASVWILSTSQVANSDPDIAAIAPFTF